MATDKKSFILYCDLLAVVRLLPDDKAGLLFKHILQYVNDENPETDDLIVRLTFEPIKQQLKRDLSKWEKTIGKNSDAGINSALSKFKSKILANLKSVDIDFEISHCKKRISENGGSDYYFEQCLMFLNEIQRNSTTVDSVATKSTDTVTVTDTVNDNVNEDTEDRQGEFSEPSFIFTSPTIELGKEKKVAPKKETFDFKNALLFFVNDEQVVNDYMEVRKKKKGANTETAFNLLMDKINESNMLPIDCIKKCIERNWLSFDIEWLNNSNNNKQQNNGKPQKIGGIDIETLKRNHATIEEFKRKEQDSGNNDW